ncbi:hypothetical protein [Parvularcula maris]|uniref:DUF3618 domain-containing protein n=1 Tax=Parvularcula maris TaxID=2965077 RepID=A0A9X2L6V7_9PROT|nr:hypothetical protein [Parvularcula maris]MCQ8184146.1 hypothetical protein [Parvularcula maris]
MADTTSTPDTGSTAPNATAQDPVWKDKQHEVEAEAKQTAKRAGSLASNTAARKIDEHKSELQRTIENVASGLEKGQEELDRSQLQDLTLSAAEQLRRFASNLDTTDGQALMQRLGQESRKRPVSSALAGAIAGFAMGRALRATPQTADSYPQTGDRQPTDNQFGSASTSSFGDTAAASPSTSSTYGAASPSVSTPTPSPAATTSGTSPSASFADNDIQSEAPVDPDRPAAASPTIKSTD